MKNIIPIFMLALALNGCSNTKNINVKYATVVGSGQDTVVGIRKDTVRGYRHDTTQYDSKSNVQNIEQICSPETIAVFSGHVAIPDKLNKQGTISSTGIPEFKYNDDLVSLLNTMSNCNINYQTFLATENISLTNRINTASSVNSKIYLEIHHDAAQKSDIELFNSSENSKELWNVASGFSIFYNQHGRDSLQSYTLATLIGEELLKNGFHPNHYHKKDIDGERRKLINPEFGIYNGSHLFVLKKEQTPALLVECGVIVNPNEDAAHNDSLLHEKFANAINTALNQYMNILKVKNDK